MTLFDFSGYTFPRSLPEISADTWIMIIIVILTFVGFLILREITCWYWKIHSRIALAEESNILIHEQNTLLVEQIELLTEILREIRHEKNPKSQKESTTTDIIHHITKPKKTIKKTKESSESDDTNDTTPTI